jgi:hypothetical protein
MFGIGIGVGIGRQRFASGIFSAYADRVAADGGTTEAGACVDAVSALLQTASLLLVPSGYKSGKVYSQIPTNGDGDLTFTRASTAVRTNSTGLLESMATGVPRLDYSQGSCPALLLEPQRTNLMLYSEQFDNASWEKSIIGINTSIGTNGIESNVANAPSETLTADRVNFTLQSDLDVGLKQVHSSAVATQSFVASIYVKGEGSNIGKQIKLRIKRSIGGSFVSVDTTITLTSNWVRITSSALTLVASNTGVQYIISSNDATNALIWGAQLEAGSNATSYIPTTTATVTRNADVISKTGISSLIGQTEGTIFIDAQITNFAETAQSFITISDGTIFNRVELRKSSTSQIVLEGAASTGSFPGFTLSSVAVGRYKIAVAYQSGNSYLYINGAQVGTTSANAFAFTSLTNIVVGANATGSTRFLNDRINLATVFKTRLTPDQLILLTGASFSSYPEMANALIYTIQ